MERIYHRYEFWECWKNGFFDNISGVDKNKKIQKVIELFSDQQKTKEYMNKVIEQWKYSCEHNLTNDSMNKIAWLGQSACCIYDKIPSSITMEAWHLVSKENRDKADSIASEIIENYLNNLKNEKKQLCLKFH